MEGVRYPCPHCARAFHRVSDLHNHLAVKCKNLVPGATPHLLRATNPQADHMDRRAHMEVPFPEVPAFTTGPRSTTRRLPGYPQDPNLVQPSMAAALGGYQYRPETPSQQGTPYGWMPPYGFQGFDPYHPMTYGYPASLAPYMMANQAQHTEGTR